jgi:hypothetical protein
VNTSRSQLLFVSDQPFADEVASFNFDPIIGTLRDFIRSAPTNAPLNICVSGSWGTGKTTLLRGLEKKFLEDEDQGPDPHYVTIWFDPWKLSDEQQVRNALARSVLDVIERDASFAARADISIDRKNVLRMLGDRLLGVNPDDVSTIYKAEARTRDTFVEIQEMFRRVADVYLNDEIQPRRLVIFVDDLDRCRPARVTDVLESIKLFFDLPGLIFVFALDSDQLERAVMVDYGFTQAEARVYLEKIFQLTVPLPRKGGAELQKFLETTLKEVGVELTNDRLSEAIVNRFGRNLRRLKLFINTFSFQRRLMGDLGDLDDESLIRWLYLETTMGRSLTIALRDGRQNLVIALELLAHGGFLHDPDLLKKYVAELQTGTLNYAALIVYSIVAQQELEELPSRRLDSMQQGIVEALQADGSVIPTLKVVREGEKLLIDSDLRRMIFLTRSEETEAPATTSSDDSVKYESPTLNWANPLRASEWDLLGDRLDRDGDRVDAYLCYLMAFLCQPQSLTYTCDLARGLRRMGHFNAAKALLADAYRMEPASPYLFVEVAYMYDLELKDETIGSLLYRKAIQCGSVGDGPPYYLAINLKKEGRLDEAYLACLHACVISPNDETKRKQLIALAQESGRSDQARDRAAEELAQELREARENGSYPLALTEAEEGQVRELLSEQVDPELASNEMSRAL